MIKTQEICIYLIFAGEGMRHSVNIFLCHASARKWMQKALRITHCASTQTPRSTSDHIKPVEASVMVPSPLLVKSQTAYAIELRTKAVNEKLEIEEYRALIRK